MENEVERAYRAHFGFSSDSYDSDSSISNESDDWKPPPRKFDSACIVKISAGRTASDHLEQNNEGLNCYGGILTDIDDEWSTASSHTYISSKSESLPLYCDAGNNLTDLTCKSYQQSSVLKEGSCWATLNEEKSIPHTPLNNLITQSMNSSDTQGQLQTILLKYIDPECCETCGQVVPVVRSDSREQENLTANSSNDTEANGFNLVQDFEDFEILAPVENFGYSSRYFGHKKYILKPVKTNAQVITISNVPQFKRAVSFLNEKYRKEFMLENILKIKSKGGGKRTFMSLGSLPEIKINFTSVDKFPPLSTFEYPKMFTDSTRTWANIVNSSVSTQSSSKLSFSSQQSISSTCSNIASSKKKRSKKSSKSDTVSQKNIQSNSLKVKGVGKTKGNSELGKSSKQACKNIQSNTLTIRGQGINKSNSELGKSKEQTVSATRNISKQNVSVNNCSTKKAGNTKKLGTEVLLRESPNKSTEKLTELAVSDVHINYIDVTNDIPVSQDLFLFNDPLVLPVRNMENGDIETVERVFEQNGLSFSRQSSKKQDKMPENNLDDHSILSSNIVGNRCLTLSPDNSYESSIDTNQQNDFFECVDLTRLISNRNKSLVKTFAFQNTPEFDKSSVELKSLQKGIRTEYVNPVIDEDAKMNEVMKHYKIQLLGRKENHDFISEGEAFHTNKERIIGDDYQECKKHDFIEQTDTLLKYPLVKLEKEWTDSLKKAGQLSNLKSDDEECNIKKYVVGGIDWNHDYIVSSELIKKDLIDRSLSEVSSNNSTTFSRVHVKDADLDDFEVDKKDREQSLDRNICDVGMQKTDRFNEEFSSVLEKNSSSSVSSFTVALTDIFAESVEENANFKEPESKLNDSNQKMCESVECNIVCADTSEVKSTLACDRIKLTNEVNRTVEVKTKKKKRKKKKTVDDQLPLTDLEVNSLLELNIEDKKGKEIEHKLLKEENQLNGHIEENNQLQVNLKSNSSEELYLPHLANYTGMNEEGKPMTKKKMKEKYKASRLESREKDDEAYCTPYSLILSDLKGYDNEETEENKEFPEEISPSPDYKKLGANTISNVNTCPLESTVLYGNMNVITGKGNKTKSKANNALVTDALNKLEVQKTSVSHDMNTPVIEYGVGRELKSRRARKKNKTILNTEANYVCKQDEASNNKNANFKMLNNSEHVDDAFFAEIGSIGQIYSSIASSRKEINSYFQKINVLLDNLENSCKKIYIYPSDGQTSSCKFIENQHQQEWKWHLLRKKTRKIELPIKEKAEEMFTNFITYILSPEVRGCNEHFNNNAITGEFDSSHDKQNSFDVVNTNSNAQLSNDQLFNTSSTRETKIAKKKKKKLSCDESNLMSINTAEQTAIKKTYAEILSEEQPTVPNKYIGSMNVENLSAHNISNFASEYSDNNINSTCSKENEELFDK